MSETYDVVGIGLGPFNLGLAALAEPLVAAGELSAAFFDRREDFVWHEGMMLPWATIQVPFLADLVSLADPTSRFSFLNYLKQQGRIHRYYIREDFYPLRSEYSAYCAWVAGQLSTTTWSTEVTGVRRDPDGLWTVTLSDAAGAREVRAYHVVSGVGTTPNVPAPLAEAVDAPGVWHSSEFLHHRGEIEAADSVTVVGSGQSAAEIYRALMETAAANGTRLDWFTRSPRFFPMEYTKLTLELTSPEYTGYFHGLDTARRDSLNQYQRNLHKGISADLINDIYDTLDRLSIQQPLDTTLRTGVSATWSPGAEPTDGSTGRHRLHLAHGESGATGVHASDVVILATGYRPPQLPDFLRPAAGHIRFDERGRMAVGLEFDIDEEGTLFVQNAEEHTHALSAPDLGMGPWRNSVILKRITGREVYPVERAFAHQSFGGEGL
ncbi:lysine N(6)-hydroxylase/L-ornithine N(5)-oxygenase family protein [Corynebacterium halotolerans]|uniref:lysine N(6)-hydroxylase/L-ornithine N(5)-oxygenase family protein n=1 Tax=Corynebacterium halotolerans TaxID=225326 RepID=UPI003CEB2F45